MRKILALLSAAALALSGCSTTNTDTSGTTTGDTNGDTTHWPLTIGEVTIDKAPTKIVSLSPTATEDLFAVGAGDLIVAADSYSTYPPQAPTTELSGFQPSAEEVLTFKPDLVVTSTPNPDFEKALNTVGVPVIVMPAADTIADAYTQIEQLGALTNHVADAAAVVADTQTRIDKATATAGEKGNGLKYYHEVDPTFYTITDHTFLGNVYSLFGMTSIAPADGSDYPQLSPEAIIAANPDIIFLADSEGAGGVTAADVAARPGWNTIPAVTNHAIYPLNVDIASRWSPRIADLVEAIAHDLTTLPATATAH
ncbi:ABC transporter substrate-binding protein [Corynebacterium aquilae]|uniref:ABC transporter substrate-binding protein n=1 Tax=Corynebacterium aquilae DSM 44791 TaxID=1431546 RepID=A0A1L7CDT7_9CORY|nr:ABC transporter substrate-binding protein [Corynebacterium aquilae]APT83988.1 ABC transporter substrate-binding protein [Corynebacterium aquilae DSM 44791]